tara:strand:+ start:1174 stop:1605 length:432 start_codon:yes stop_codon:yes gene_type:complete
MFLVYRIYDLETAECYVGSTNKINKRITFHKSPFSRASSKQIVEKNNYEVEILEENIEEDDILWKERDYIEKYNCINMRRPIITEEERKEHDRCRKKEYYLKNKEKLNEKMECICGSTFVKREKARHEKRDKHKRYLQNNNLS